MASDALTITIDRDDRQALLPWSVAAANRDAEPATILAIGDSITEGNNSSFVTRRWIDRLRDRLRAALPVEGVPVSAAPCYIPAWYQAPIVGPKFTHSGTFTKPSSFGLGHRCVVLGTPGDSLTATVTGTSVRIMHVTSSAGAVYSITVDGGTPIQVDATQAGDAADGALSPLVPFGSRGEHTVVITAVSGAPYIDGMFVYDGDETAGIRVIDGGKGGWKAHDGLNTAAKIESIGETAAAVDPSLVTIAFGTNDFFNNVDPVATFRPAVEQWISRIRQTVTSPAPAFLLLGHVDVPGTYTYAGQEYRDQLAAIAQADAGVAYLDLNATVPGSAGDTLGLYAADQVHPSDRGMALIAATVADYLSSAVR